MCKQQLATPFTYTGPQDHYSEAGSDGKVNVSLLQPQLGGALLGDTPTVDRAASLIITADSGRPTAQDAFTEWVFSLNLIYILHGGN